MRKEPARRKIEANGFATAKRIKRRYARTGFLRFIDLQWLRRPASGENAHWQARLQSAGLPPRRFRGMTNVCNKVCSFRFVAAWPRPASDRDQ
jgi:hypothetical protein